MQTAGVYHTIVIVDTNAPAANRIVGTASLIVERKFTHHCGKVGHIEDVVTDEACRGKGFGKV